MNPRPDTVVGRIPVLECLRAGKRRARRLFLLHHGKGLEELRRAARGVPIEEAGRQDLDRMAKGVVHQGVVLEADELPVLDLDDWLDGDLPPDAFLVMLDGIEDPQNLGAIVRSAAACGAAAALLGKDRAAPLSSAAQKAAAGAMEHLPLIRATNLQRAQQKLQDAGFWTAVLEADAPRVLWEADLRGRIVLIIGSEGKGVRRLLRERADMALRIPLEGAITSLNASVSAGIALAECRRQRWAPGNPKEPV